MAITRRVFLKQGALAVVGTAAVPSFLTRAAFAAGGTARNKRLVVLFQRGAADGLNLVVPHGDALYYRLRPSIAIPPGAVLDLNGYFGLHPALAPLKPLWDARRLAIVHAAGSPDSTRSHFDAQDYMESGTPGVKSTEDGWLNRALGTWEAAPRPSPFRAVSLGANLPRALAGSRPAIAVKDVREFGVDGGGGGPAGATFESMYASTADAVLHGTGQETFAAVKMLKAADPARYAPAPGAVYPRGPFAQSLRQLAQLMKADLGVETAFADIGGWDHHNNEGSVQGRLANVAGDFARSLAAFWTDLGDIAADTVIVTMSEFGRTVRENGTRGTDHGHANVMFVLGGPVRGGQLLGRWPGLDDRHLYEGRDLEVTTDFRAVLGEALTRHMGCRDLAAVFPGFTAPGRIGLVG
jgi:uncharacterized protein (DUF1501 family)